ncbi:MAG: (5-formylfuran-3-yl)methyl phosphate synthase, partial [Candidatus Entotheonellia bacterium]
MVSDPIDHICSMEDPGVTRPSPSLPRLLASVRDAAEARAALQGGADVLDAKEPSAGPLGACTPAVLHAIA